MNVIIARTYRINMGNYESFEVKASVSMSHNDLGITDEEMQTRSAAKPKYLDEVFDELRQQIDGYIDDLVRNDIEAADDLTVDDNSFIRRIRRG